MTSTPEPLDIDDAAQWRDWLLHNHARQSEAWLTIYKKKYQDQGLALEAAIAEALCFGWIDSTLQPLDEKRFYLRFSPRKPGSIWSMSNIRRVEKLIAAGKMTGAGQQKIDVAKKNGEWDAAIRREQIEIIPKELERELEKIKGALPAYHALPASRKKRYIYWLQSAKRAETKQIRTKKILAEILATLPPEP
jgi:uncharacterized protein YdeI (YjbR/CyaY-like superfamily)